MSRRRPTKTKKVLNKKNSRRGLYLIGAAVLVAVISVGFLIAQNAPRDVGDIVSVETKTWPEPDGPALGAADAPVVIREFSDFQCPFCRQFSERMKGQIIDQLVAAGQVRFEYHHFIVIDGNVGGTESRDAAEASMCAAEQNRFWDYHDMLFANQLGEGVGSFHDARLKAFAGDIGLDQAEFDACVDSRRYRDEVVTDQTLGQRLGVRGTPALFVNDQLVENAFDIASVQAAVQAALNESSQ